MQQWQRREQACESSDAEGELPGTAACSRAAAVHASGNNNIVALSS